MPVSSPETKPGWPPEPASGRGRSHGTSGVEPFDRWFRYPAGFASDYAALLLDNLGLTSGTVVDCFAGSGVTGTAARSRGLNFVGIEAHPLVAELATLKLSPIATSGEVRELSQKVVASAHQPLSGATPDLEDEPDLVRRCFSPSVLDQLVRLRHLVRAHADTPASSYLKWALLGVLRDVADVKVGWPYQRPGVTRRAPYADPIARFTARAEIMASDLESIADSETHAEVLIGDARDGGVWSRIPEPAAACVASPPYLNNFDYADATRLELYFWGEVTTWGGMCREVRADMLTATTQQSSVGEKAAALDWLRNHTTETGERILSLVGLVEEAQAARGNRAKEYDRVVPAYFAAMASVLGHLHDHVEPGGAVLWLVGDSAPYGVHVDTPALVGGLAQDAGFDFAEDVRLRIRGNRWPSNADRHQVELSERLIVLRRATTAQP
ncbi:DNA methylase [Propionicimonas paludicola]|uniref:DNA methylase n=1 Tax=Propionicimonas paludicola TaxID=185243 RepID=A0A2A9CNY1_9ACTN|nr:DNA methyltransferase [Propionicimonas paludicola]PFG16048.1 DNA methylase [Propionicimonas paludicola]